MNNNKYLLLSNPSRLNDEKANKQCVDTFSKDGNDLMRVSRKKKHKEWGSRKGNKGGYVNSFFICHVLGRQTSSYRSG